MLGKSPLTQRGPCYGETSTEDLQSRNQPRSRGLRAAPAPETLSCPFRVLALRKRREDQTLKEKHTMFQLPSSGMKHREDRAHSPNVIKSKDLGAMCTG